MKAKAAVFVGVGAPIEIREFPLAKPEPGGLLARILMCTVCGSDVHTWLGHRPGKMPSILGHEMVGVVADLGAGVTRDYLGQPIAPGDRITWSMYASCGACYYCRVAGLPQKCTSLYKYGHESCAEPPYLNGGFAEYVHLRPGTGIIKVPAELADEEVSPLNCATATIASGLDALRVESGDVVVVQGLGMLGMCTCAMARQRGAGRVVAVDVDGSRLALAGRFGASDVIQARGLTAEAMGELVRGLSGGHGADLVVEVSGNPAVVPAGLAMCRRGGRYLLLGLVSPGADLAIGSRLAAASDARRSRTWLRGLAGRCFAAVARRMVRLAIRDTQCGFKMFRGEVGRKLFSAVQERGYLFDLELLALASRLGYKIAEVPVDWTEVPGGHLSLSRDLVRILVNLWHLRRRLAVLSPRAAVS